MRLHYSKKFYARLTIDKKIDEVKRTRKVEKIGGNELCLC